MGEFAGDVLEVWLAAPPVQGKANRELVELLSRTLSIGRSKVVIVRGHTARNKVVAIEGLSREEVVGRLAPPRSGLG